MKNSIIALCISLWTSAVVYSSTPVFVLKGTYPDVAGDLIEQVTVVGDYAYLANGVAGFRIINISNPAAPYFVGAETTPNYSRGVAVEGHYAYIADFVSGLQVIDVADPAHPVHRSTCSGPGSSCIAVSGRYVYLAGFSSDLWIIDITDPEHPTLASTFPRIFCRALVLQGGYVFAVSPGHGLSIIDVKDPLKPMLVSTHKNGTYDFRDFRGIIVSGNYAYLLGIAVHAPYLRILEVVDISDLSHPTSVAQLALTAGDFLAATGDYVVVSDELGQLDLIDVTDPSRPKALATHYGKPRDPSNYLSRCPVVSGGLIYWPNAQNGLEILSIEQAPSLSISPNGGQGTVQVNWEKGPGIKLQRTHDLINPVWEDVEALSEDGTIPVSSSEAQCFFRVVKMTP